MMAMKVAVAFQTMRQTSPMSANWTTPVASASAAPSNALQPMDRPRGCQMTSVMVRMKIAAAASIEGSDVTVRDGC